MTDDRDTKRGVDFPSVQQTLGGWIFVLKDLLKRSVTAFEEADLLLSSARFLGRYGVDQLAARRRQSAHVANPLFAGLSSNLEVELGRLRTLREDIRDDLLVIQLVSDKLTFDELTTRARPRYPGEQRDEAALLSRPGPPDGTIGPYLRALRILSSTQSEPIIENFDAVLNLMRNPGASSTTSERRTERDWMRIAESIRFQKQFQDLFRLTAGHEDEFWSAIGAQLVRMQEEAIFQSEWLVANEVPDAKRLDELMREWFDRVGRRGLVELISAVFGSGRATSTEEAARRRAVRLYVRSLFTSGEREWRQRRESLAKFVIRTADRCWIERKRRLLGRVAAYKVHGAIDVRSKDPNPIHRDLFRRVRSRQIALRASLDRLQAIVRALQQRAAVLPPTFPSVPSFHRRERERVASALSRLLEVMVRTTSRLLRALGVLKHDLRAELSFSYVFSSSVHTIDDLSGRSTAIIEIPFFFIELPKHIVNVAHELAHASFSHERVQRIAERIDRDTPAPLRRAVQIAHADLTEAYRWSGTRRTSQGPSALIAEVLADFVALCAAGPHYIYSLAFTTLGYVRVPGDEAISSAVSALSPIVRLAALIRATGPLFGAGLSRCEWWHPRRLHPIESIIDSYFAILANSGLEGTTAGELFRREIDVLETMFAAIVRWLGKSHDLSSLAVHVTEDRVVLQRAQEVAQRMSTIARDMFGTDEGRVPFSRAACLVAPKSSGDSFSSDNALHVLWDWTLSEHERSAVESASPSAVSPEVAWLERLLWIRSPEIRPVLALLQPPQATGSGSSGVEKDPPRERGRAQIITVWEIKALWEEERSRAGWHDFPSRPADRASWVLGDHDLRLVAARFDGPEPLDRRITRVRSVTPIDPVHQYVRALDYEVIGEKEEVPRDRVTALFRLRADRPLVATELDEVLGDDGTWCGPLLSSFGWDHYAVEVVFESFLALARIDRRLTERVRGRHRTVNLTHPVVREARFELPSEALGVFERWSSNESLSTIDGPIEIVGRMRAPRTDWYTGLEAFREKVPRQPAGGSWRVELQATTGLDTFSVRIALPRLRVPTGDYRYQSEIFQAYVFIIDEAILAWQVAEVQTSVVLPSGESIP